jgi:hypothetical protein
VCSDNQRRPEEAQAGIEAPPAAKSRKGRTIPAIVEPIELVADADEVEEEEDTET